MREGEKVNIVEQSKVFRANTVSIQFICGKWKETFYSTYVCLDAIKTVVNALKFFITIYVFQILIKHSAHTQDVVSACLCAPDDNAVTILFPAKDISHNLF